MLSITMKLNSFQIENFRSISNVTCDLSQKITIFAGKNESGKTNILHALGLINENSKFDEEDHPTYLLKDDPTIITYNFELTKEEKIELGKRLLLNLENLSSNISIKYWPEKDEYEITGSLIDDIEGLLYKTTDRALKELKEKITSILSEMKTKAYQTADYPVIVSLDDVSTSQINEYLEQLKKNIPKISPTEQNPNPKQDPLINKINEIIMHVRTISISEKVTQAEDEIWNMRPTIVTFSSFGDTLPDQVPFLEFTNPDLLKKNRPIVHDLIKLSDLDVTKLQNNNKLKRQNLTDIAAGISSQKFSEFWKQNPIEFVFDVDNESASIFIRDKGKTFSYKPEQRSEGFQWFLSFFLRLEATGREKNNLILVDEPGLYLHFRAQKDVLAVFTKLAENNQIIFTTHSPYLIDPENLNQVRLVRKHDDKSIIQNNFHEGGTDADTLTPIITALDLDLTKDCFSTDLVIIL